MASVARRRSRPFGGHLVASFVEPRRRQPCGDPAARRDPGNVIERDLYQAHADPRIRREKPSLASLAGSADWSGIGIFIRRRWSTRDRSSAELFRNDADASGGNGLALWIGIGGYRQCLSLEFWIDQHADTF